MLFNCWTAADIGSLFCWTVVDVSNFYVAEMLVIQAVCRIAELLGILMTSPFWILIPPQDVFGQTRRAKCKLYFTTFILLETIDLAKQLSAERSSSSILVRDHVLKLKEYYQRSGGGVFICLRV